MIQQSAHSKLFELTLRYLNSSGFAWVVSLTALALKNALLLTCFHSNEWHIPIGSDRKSGGWGGCWVSCNVELHVGKTQICGAFLQPLLHHSVSSSLPLFCFYMLTLRKTIIKYIYDGIEEKGSSKETVSEREKFVSKVFPLLYCCDSFVLNVFSWLNIKKSWGAGLWPQLSWWKAFMLEKHQQGYVALPLFSGSSPSSALSICTWLYILLL